MKKPLAQYGPAGVADSTTCPAARPALAARPAPAARPADDDDDDDDDDLDLFGSDEVGLSCHVNQITTSCMSLADT